MVDRSTNVVVDICRALKHGLPADLGSRRAVWELRLDERSEFSLFPQFTKNLLVKVIGADHKAFGCLIAG